MILLSFPIRFTIKGDGKSTHVEFDLKDTIVQFLNGTSGIIPNPNPIEIISARLGGPGISPEDDLMRHVMGWKLDGSVVILDFAIPLLEDYEHYTVEMILGYGQKPKPESEEIQ